MAVYTADVAHLEPRAVGVTAFTVDDSPSILDQELFSAGRAATDCVRRRRRRIGRSEGDSGVDLQGLMPADGAACEIGVARRMYDRKVLFDRELAPSEGVTRQVG
jgi:hypothetical protein